MAITKKGKRSIIIGAAVFLFGLYYYRNPNNKAWKNAADGQRIDMSRFKGITGWFPFGGSVTLTDINGATVGGKLSGNKIAWDNGGVWTY